MNEHWTHNAIKHYRAMIGRHVPLWEFIEAFIKRNAIKSIVDCGGGIGYAAQFVETDRYALFDQNETMIKYSLEQGRQAYYGDFTQTDVEHVKGFDLVLIAGVVEHAMVLEPFIQKALEVQSKYIVVSFFNGFKPVGKIIKSRRGCCQKIYSETEIQEIVETLNLAGAEILQLHPDPDRIYRSGTRFDGVLLINCQAQNDVSV